MEAATSRVRHALVTLIGRRCRTFLVHPVPNDKEPPMTSTTPRACERCAGRVLAEEDRFGRFETCLVCGSVREMASLVTPAQLLAAARLLPRSRAARVVRRTGDLSAETHDERPRAPGPAGTNVTASAREMRPEAVAGQ